MVEFSPLTFIAHCQREGFTPAEAGSFYAELVALASPCQFEWRRVRRSAWLRALAYWHRNLRVAIQRVRTVEDWVTYCHGWARATFEGPTVNGEQYVAHGAARDFVRSHWAVLSLGEPAGAFDRRCEGPWLEPDPTLPNWDALQGRIQHPRLLRRLLDEVDNPLPEPADLGVVRREWAAMLRHTGLRSVRWHWAENLASAEQRGLAVMLGEVQWLLDQPLNLGGPLLGLAGATGLELMAGVDAHGQGHVRLDPYPTGQTLMVDDWGVLAHEWLHTLDITLARDTGQNQRYLTLALADDEPTLPSNDALAQAGGAWWTLVDRIQMAPLPADVFRDVQADLARWPERFRDSLGKAASLDVLIATEQQHMAQHTWTVAGAAQRWTRWLKTDLMADDALAEGTAQWLVRDLELTAWPDRVPDDEPTWAWSLRQQKQRDQLGQGPSRLHGAYLAHPIELMARSFEAAMGPGDGVTGPVWSAMHSSIGMIWPTPSELRHQAIGWRMAMTAIKGWWALRCAIAAPLGHTTFQTERMTWRLDHSANAKKPESQSTQAPSWRGDTP